ncbi:serine/threonine-protein kinase [Methylomonas sp. MO1]|uniref:serine/threonine-protein kinase n=1 Tax=unclassified Methylomonas TaxID=2608980 RepID=UPI0018CBF457|nr:MULTISPECIES: serine/threonine-protein kinase [unclassified Methylomonas]MDT4287981.1 serine/threonine-protein kinase [Methylomonas sp. MO1]
MEFLGAGSIGNVYKAFDKQRNQRIAIKILKSHFTGDGPIRQNFLDKAKLNQTLAHPCIVKVFDVGEDGPLAFYTMEFLEGKPLGQFFRNLRSEGKTLGVKSAIALIEQACQALEYAHGKGIVHGSAYIENLWLGNTGKIKIMEFGFGAHASFLTPEQSYCFDGSQTSDQRNDQFLLAFVLCLLLTGNKPAALPYSGWPKNVPNKLGSVVEKALAMPDERFQTIRQFRLALRGQHDFQSSRLGRMFASFTNSCLGTRP